VNALAIYLAVEDISQVFPALTWDGMTTFSMTVQQVASFSNCTTRTAIKHMARLLELGLPIKVPDSVIPAEFSHSRRASFYALPELTEETVIAMLDRLRVRGR
jgi:hypothetical protein